MNDVQDPGHIFMIKVKYSVSEYKVYIFINSHSNTIHKILLVNLNQNMEQMIIMTSGMMIMFVCLVHHLISR